jgi:hypothetical protein
MDCHLPSGKKSILCYVVIIAVSVFFWVHHSALNLSPHDGQQALSSQGRLFNRAEGSACIDSLQQQQQHPPILASTGITRGFHPVFVYSNVEPLRIRSYAQVAQDEVVMKLCKANDEKRKNAKLTKESNSSEKYFVDLASNDAASFSNTLHLEQNGWKGLCIEPNPRYWYRLAAYRQCTIVGAFVGGTEDGKEVDVILSNHVYGGIVGEGFDNEKKRAEEKRNLVSISTVFQETQVPTVIDYMSLDVEGAETLVMQDFPFDTYKISFLTIERPKDDLRELLKKNGYKTIHKDISNFGETLWFHEKSVALTQEEVEDIACKDSKHCFVPVPP